MIDSQYIQFYDAEPLGRKTRIVIVVSKSSGAELGSIKWYGPWRQYCFYPASATIFNTGCMNDIQAQIKELMDERKSKPLAVKMNTHENREAAVSDWPSLR